jgi:hypothetical protein
MKNVLLCENYQPSLKFVGSIGYHVVRVHVVRAQSRGAPFGRSSPTNVSTSFQPGDRVRIRALRDTGSARLLDGLSGEVVGPHPIARNWYKIRLDANHISPHSEWTAPFDRLVAEEHAPETDGDRSSVLAQQITVKHWP